VDDSFGGKVLPIVVCGTDWLRPKETWILFKVDAFLKKEEEQKK
jgi:hypothetical protein